jgi:hypothetical protein
MSTKMLMIIGMKRSQTEKREKIEDIFLIQKFCHFLNVEIGVENCIF